MNNRSMDSCHNANDEISLVDLAVTFVRRRRIFYVVMLVCTVAGVVYALMADSTYRYTSLMQGAMVASDQPLTAPPALIATLETRWLPETKARYESDHSRLPFNVAFENPKETYLVKIITETGENHADLVKRIHTTLMDQVAEDQATDLDERRNRLKKQIETTSDLIASLKKDGVTGEALASAVDRQLNLQLELSSLQPAKSLVIARQSVDATGPRRTLIVALSVVLGGMLGVFAAFFTEFLVAVRTQMAQRS
jgi:uncharacterized protein involved in exopolysaccharide biosynthesis